LPKRIAPHLFLCKLPVPCKCHTGFVIQTGQNERNWIFAKKTKSAYRLGFQVPFCPSPRLPRVSRKATQSVNDIGWSNSTVKMLGRSCLSAGQITWHRSANSSNSKVSLRMSRRKTGHLTIRLRGTRRKRRDPHRERSESPI